METMAVEYNGQLLMVHKEVAEELGLSHGQRIRTEDEFWHVLGQNLAMTVAKIEISKAMGG